MTFDNSNNLLELEFHAHKTTPNSNSLNDLLDTIILLGYNIDNQRNGLETQAKASMLLTRHP